MVQVSEHLRDEKELDIYCHMIRKIISSSSFYQRIGVDKMKTSRSQDLNVSIKLNKRAKNRLNKTERLILHFLLSRHLAGDEYHTYSSDPTLLKVIKKSQEQTSRALRSLTDRGLLLATPDHQMNGCPRIYHLVWWKLGEVKVLLKADGFLAGMVAAAYGRIKAGSVTTPELAHVLNISKRSAQRIAKINVNGGIWRRTKNGKKRRYSETRGQLPLEHFNKERSN